MWASPRSKRTRQWIAPLTHSQDHSQASHRSERAHADQATSLKPAHPNTHTRARTHTHETYTHTHTHTLSREVCTVDCTISIMYYTTACGQALAIYMGEAILSTAVILICKKTLLARTLTYTHARTRRAFRHGADPQEKCHRSVQHRRTRTNAPAHTYLRAHTHTPTHARRNITSHGNYTSICSLQKINQLE